MIAGWVRLGAVQAGKFEPVLAYRPFPFGFPLPPETATSMPLVRPSESVNTRLTHAGLYDEPGILLCSWALPPIHLAGQPWPGHLAIVTIAHRLTLALNKSAEGKEVVSMEIRPGDILGVVDQANIVSHVQMFVRDGVLVQQTDAASPHVQAAAKRSSVTIG